MKRKIWIAIFVMIFLAGVWGTLNRKEPYEKYMGHVYISDGSKETALRGDKVSVCRGGKLYEYEYPSIQKERVCVLDAKSGNGAMKVSYSKEFYGDVDYTIYDADLNVLSSHQTALNVPGGSDKVYYVSVVVCWGTEEDNIKMIYYFSIRT